MTKRSTPKMAVALFLISAATTIAAQAQTFTTLANTPGEPFLMSLAQGSDGSFYGTTAGDGAFTFGTVFKVTPQGTIATLHSFCAQKDCRDGNRPQGALVQATNGNFYGITVFGGNGGTNGNGTIFRITPAGGFATVYRFCAGGNSCSDGANPEGGLIQAADGSLYGTTLGGGGTNGYGTVFRITLGGRLTTLHVFSLESDGRLPFAGLVQGTDGNFYGTTSIGGFNHGCNSGSCGTIFRMTSKGSFKTVYRFHSLNDGAVPYSGLIQGTDGNFYGATSAGGDLTCVVGGCGTVFKIAMNGTLTTLHTFEMTDGAGPFASPIQATDGNFYGTTIYGGGTPCPYGCGTIYQITSGGGFTTLYDFCIAGSPCPDGSVPFSGLNQGTNGKLYGASSSTVFSLDMGLGPFVAFIRNPAKVGRPFGILGQGFTGTTSVSLNGISAGFTVVSDTLIEATVPAGATTGYVTVATPSGTLTSNVPFHVIP